jgi:very-short-patch-repair endonuclease
VENFDLADGKPISPSTRGTKGEGGSNMDKATKHGHYLYNKNLRPLAGVLRKNMTKAEACLWKYVLRAPLTGRAGMMKGYTFNRQRPVMDYITDFFCKSLRLVVEVDGITHYDEDTHLKDRNKERELEKAGFKVVRFTDEEVLNNIEGVRGALESCVEEREKDLGFTSPRSPSERGTLLHQEEQELFRA